MSFGAGLVGGMLSSMPFGPINLILVDLVSRRHFARVLAFLAGVILGDGLVAAASLWGLVRVDPDPWVALVLGGGCAAILFVYAVASWRSSSSRVGVPSPPASILQSAALGFSFCFFNPLFALFWVSFIAGYRELFDVDVISAPAFVSGMVIGDLVWFAVVGAGAMAVMRNRGETFLIRLRQATSLGILGCSFLLMVAVVKRAL
jgi:threonine/homoserine/homoserine lactone efflux protein